MKQNKYSCVICFIVCFIATSNTTPFHEETNIESNGPADEMEKRASFPSVTEYYQINQDLTKVIWAHGVDKRKTLTEALKGNTMMIEADVSSGRVKFQPSMINVPIMAHPPAKLSDLSLENFLDTIINDDNPKGIKLDIKDINILDDALNIIKVREEKIKVPLWLNADILPGPVQATGQPVDPHRFLTSVKNYFPGAVISVGWTTRYGPDVPSSLEFIKEGSYTFDQVRQMRDVLIAADIIQPVTFPIRAGLSTSVESQKNIIWLLNQVEGSTVTIWGSLYDSVDVPALMELIKAVGKDRVYIDVPNGLHCQISRYRTYNSILSSLFGSSGIVGRRTRLSAAASVLAFLAYISCLTNYLPWKTESYTIA